MGLLKIENNFKLYKILSEKAKMCIFTFSEIKQYEQNFRHWISY